MKLKVEIIETEHWRTFEEQVNAFCDAHPNVKDIKYSNYLNTDRCATYYSALIVMEKSDDA